MATMKKVLLKVVILGDSGVGTFGFHINPIILLIEFR